MDTIGILRRMADLLTRPGAPVDPHVTVRFGEAFLISGNGGALAFLRGIGATEHGAWTVGPDGRRWRYVTATVGDMRVSAMEWAREAPAISDLPTPPAGWRVTVFLTPEGDELGVELLPVGPDARGDTTAGEIDWWFRAACDRLAPTWAYVQSGAIGGPLGGFWSTFQ